MPPHQVQYPGHSISSIALNRQSPKLAYNLLIFRIGEPKLLKAKWALVRGERIEDHQQRAMVEGNSWKMMHKIGRMMLDPTSCGKDHVNSFLHPSGIQTVVASGKLWSNKTKIHRIGRLDKVSELCKARIFRKEHVSLLFSGSIV